MIKVEIKESRPGIYAWEVKQFALQGTSRQPLLDACRAIKRKHPEQIGQIGMYRAGKAQPDLTCDLDIGAGLTVDERGPRFRAWSPYPD